MKKPLVVIKLGGSVITDKNKSRGVFRKAVVRRLAQEIVEARKKKDFDLILVHGAGAYAHYLTKKYRISEGFLGDKSAWGYAHIKNELFKLNNLVWTEALKAGLAVCTIQPSAVVFTDDQTIKSFDTRLLDSLLRMGITPLFLGEDSIDKSRGIAILSGDSIISYLGRKYKADKIIFVSDVDGVYDKNPKVNKDAKLIKEVNNKNFRKVIESMEKFNKNDTSGEMKGKLLAIKATLPGTNVKIIGGFEKNSLRDVLLGGMWGTRINL